MAEIHVQEHSTRKKHFIEQMIEREEEQFYHKLKRFMSESREFKGFLVFLLIAATSLILFNYFEGKGLFKSLYWLVTTVTTVGYGDNVPTKNASIIVTMITMVLGIGMLGFLATQMTEKIVSANVQGVFGLKKAKGKKHYIIAGWNNTAEAVLKEFVKENKSVVVVDSKPNPGLAHYENVTFIRYSQIPCVGNPDWLKW
ncbi:potassium channel protein [Candidatus Woesearchaeota archaeon]|nr:potassium channel protein [Candidatus Woesearchaeota archaeon]